MNADDNICERPTYASVTSDTCTCGYLERAAGDPTLPIKFDDAASEYQFEYLEADCDSASMLVIYHCPFCGGAAPTSQRELLFAVITQEEEGRLAALLAPIASIDDAIEALGRPALDTYMTVRETRLDEPEAPPQAQRARQLVFDALSSTVDVRLTERPQGGVTWTLFGKYVGD